MSDIQSTKKYRINQVLGYGDQIGSRSMYLYLYTAT